MVNSASPLIFPFKKNAVRRALWRLPSSLLREKLRISCSKPSSRRAPVNCSGDLPSKRMMPSTKPTASISRSSGTKLTMPSARARPALMRTVTSCGCDGASSSTCAWPSTTLTCTPRVVRSRSVRPGPNSSVAAPGIWMRPADASTVIKVSPFTGWPLKSSTLMASRAGVWPSAGRPFCATMTRIRPTLLLTA